MATLAKSKIGVPLKLVAKPAKLSSEYSVTTELSSPKSTDECEIVGKVIANVEADIARKLIN